MPQILDYKVRGYPNWGGVFGGLDIALDIGSLSDAESRYLIKAQANVDLQVSVAEQTFISAYFATIPPAPMSFQSSAPAFVTWVAPFSIPR